MSKQIETVFARRNPKTQGWEIRFTGVCHIDDDFIAEMEANPGKGLEHEIRGFVEDGGASIRPDAKVKIVCPENNW